MRRRILAEQVELGERRGELRPVGQRRRAILLYQLSAMGIPKQCDQRRIVGGFGRVAQRFEGSLGRRENPRLNRVRGWQHGK